MAMNPQGDYISVVATSPPSQTSSSAATSFPILILSIVGILATSVLLLGYYVFIIKCCLNRQRLDDVIGRLTSRSRRRWNLQLNAELTDGVTAERRGLDESTIRAIPTFRYREKRSDVPQWPSSFLECAVCLNGFQEEERIRLLPNCRHVFHIDCIDAWLQTSPNCPLCRSTITITVPIPPAEQELLPVELLPQQEPLQPSGEVVIRVRDDDGASDQTTVPVAGSAAINPSPWKAEQSLRREKGRKLRHVGSMGDECINVRVEDEQFHRVQPMRRSFSMDSSGDRGLYMAVQKVLQQNPHFHEVLVAGESSSSSNSGRIRRSFFSFGWSSRSAVLPVRSQL